MAVSRRYICEGCDSVVRARWDQHGGGYPGGFNVGCDCMTVPVVPQMTQAETPEQWRVERPDCCAGVDVSDLDEHYSGVCDYRCPDCGATYRWDGTMSTAPAKKRDPEELEDGQEVLFNAE